MFDGYDDYDCLETPLTSSDISDIHATGSTGGARWSTARTMPWSFVKASLPPSVITQQAKYVQACGNWKWITSEFSVF